MKEKELTVYKASGYHDTPILRIILQGQWLQNFGFSIGDKNPSLRNNRRWIE